MNKRCGSIFQTNTSSVTPIFRMLTSYVCQYFVPHSFIWLASQGFFGLVIYHIMSQNSTYIGEGTALNPGIEPSCLNMIERAIAIAQAQADLVSRQPKIRREAFDALSQRGICATHTFSRLLRWKLSLASSSANAQFLFLSPVAFKAVREWRRRSIIES